VGVGDRVATVYEGNAAVVYLAENSHEWILITAFMLAGLLALVIWAICLWRRLTGRPLPWSEFEEVNNSTAPT
jgi:hypothetical protein